MTELFQFALKTITALLRLAVLQYCLRLRALFSFLMQIGISDAEGAMAEPLSVALHAVRRAGPLLGKRVLATGCGPIGALLIIAARRCHAYRRHRCQRLHAGQGARGGG